MTNDTKDLEVFSQVGLLGVGFLGMVPWYRGHGHAAIKGISQILLLPLWFLIVLLGKGGKG